MATLTRQEMVQIIENGGSVLVEDWVTRRNGYTNLDELVCEKRLVTAVADLPADPPTVPATPGTATL